MEQYLSEDGRIAKYVHDDGSETSIKTWPEGMSCGGSGRDKWNVFISSSVGCKIKCKFCYLTSKKFPYYGLLWPEISNNIIKAIKEEIKRRPELLDIPINFSFMGMGEIWDRLDEIPDILKFVLECIPEITKIEGVDIGTTLPQIRYDDVTNLKKIRTFLNNTEKLVDRPKERSSVRVFYSLHSFFDDIRKSLIPFTTNINSALNHLSDINKDFNVIYHYIPLEGVNDNHKDYSKIVDYFLWDKKQIRFLKFNECPNGRYKNSEDFGFYLNLLATKYKDKINVKFQESPGKEISAACGMFLMSKI